MLGWKKHKLESRLPGEISITRYADDTTLMAESEEELNSLLIKVKEENEKVDLKLNIWKIKFMASGPILYAARVMCTGWVCMPPHSQEAFYPKGNQS